MKKKKSKGGQKLQLSTICGSPICVKSCGWVLFVGPLYVFNYNIVIELWVMKTENSQKLFLVSITHNSKIRELSDGNRVMETELLFAKQTFCRGSHHFWVMSYENRKLSYQKTQSKHALTDSKVYLL